MAALILNLGVVAHGDIGDDVDGDDDEEDDKDGIELFRSHYCWNSILSLLSS